MGARRSHRRLDHAVQYTSSWTNIIPADAVGMFEGISHMGISSRLGNACARLNARLKQECSELDVGQGQYTFSSMITAASLMYDLYRIGRAEFLLYNASNCGRFCVVERYIKEGPSSCQPEKSSADLVVGPFRTAGLIFP